MDILGLPLDLIPVLLPVLRTVVEFAWWLMPKTLQQIVLWQFVYLPIALFALYPLAVQYERGGLWKLLFPLYAVAGLLSAYLNYTTFAFYTWDAPRKRENTFSQRCERLVSDPGWRGWLIARPVARYTNHFDPSPPHIPLPAQPA